MEKTPRFYVPRTKYEQTYMRGKNKYELNRGQIKDTRSEQDEMPSLMIILFFSFSFFISHPLVFKLVHHSTNPPLQNYNKSQNMSCGVSRNKTCVLDVSSNMSTKKININATWHVRHIAAWCLVRHVLHTTTATKMECFIAYRNESTL